MKNFESKFYVFQEWVRFQVILAAASSRVNKKKFILLKLKKKQKQSNRISDLFSFWYF